MNKIYQKIASSSPLIDFWNSPQSEVDENKRLLKLNKESKAAYLFEKEPYKWENLYQSICREIVKGDKSSIKGLKIILDCIESNERKKLINRFENENLFSHEIINLIKSPLKSDSKTKKSIFRFIRVLLSIFLNPYKIDLKREKIHIYEKTGHLINNFRKKFNSFI